MLSCFATRLRFAPEVIQTSGMDCGPAALTSLLQGYRIPASYAKLRDACHTSVDGTSIDDLEAVAHTLGLDVSQVLMPPDQIVMAESDALPAIVVTKLPGGFAHFVLLWRRSMRFVQVMDPATGRRRMRQADFLKSLYIHTHTLDTQAWLSWATSESQHRLQARRLTQLRVGQGSDMWLAEAMESGDWYRVARLDASIRMAESLCRGGVRKGMEIRGILKRLLQSTPHSMEIPRPFWMVEALSPSDDSSLRVRGAILLRCNGQRTDPVGADPGVESPVIPRVPLSVVESPRRLWSALHGLTSDVGVWTYVALAIAVIVVASLGLVESILYRSVLDASVELVLPEQRLIAVALFLAFLASMQITEKAVMNRLFALGRHWEGRLRVALYQKLPRLAMEYLSTRPISDTAERVHSLQQIRGLPLLVGELGRAVVGFGVTVGALAWSDPDNAIWAVIAGLCALAIPISRLPRLRELNLRMRTQAGALSLYYFDALVGLMTIRAHRADRAIRREYDALLSEWMQGSRQFLVAAVTTEALQAVVGFTMAAWIVSRHTGEFSTVAGTILMAYWALQLPDWGEQIANIMRMYPTQRSVALRLLEPLSAPEEVVVTPPQDTKGTVDHQQRCRYGARIEYHQVDAQAAGRTILQNVNLAIPAGCHVGIVGTSGAGKSTLLGLLLGWLTPSHGEVRIDGEVLDQKQLERIREHIAWVDPTTELWNRSLADNVVFGHARTDSHRLGDILRPTQLWQVLERLPQGYQTPLGEQGRLLSGGESQRVRFARAMVPSQTRLAIMDEPFRGLDRGTRRQLLRNAREQWRHATLLCVTHDVSETEAFDRVIVVKDGRLLEYGSPSELAACSNSRYRQLLDAELRVQSHLWSQDHWRRFTLKDGKLVIGGQERAQESAATRDLARATANGKYVSLQAKASPR